jgi:acyl carrier protein
MTRAEVYEQLTEIFQDVFDDDELTIEDSTSAEEIEEWNSLNHITLVMEVQEKWNFKLKPQQIAQLKNVGQFVDLIFNHLNEHE